MSNFIAPQFQKRQSALSLNKNQLTNLVMENITSAVLFLDRHFVLKEFNHLYAQSIEKYTPYSPKQIRGENYFDCIPNARELLLPLFSRIKYMKTSKSVHNLPLTLKKQGEYITTRWDASILPVIDSRHTMQGLLIFTNDVTSNSSCDKVKKKWQPFYSVDKREKDLETALRVVLEIQKKDKKNIEANILSNIEKIVFPYIEKLSMDNLTSEQKICIKMIELNLQKVTSSFSLKLSSSSYNFTPKEIQIADLIRQGKQSKEIASLLSVSKLSIDTHRNKIRKKLNLNNKRINLTTHLLSLTNLK